MAILLGDALIEERARLVKAVYSTYREELWKGSDAWRAHKVAKGELDQFDLDHPGVVIEVYARFEEYQASAVGAGQK